MSKFKPMLAVNADPNALQFPVLVSPKLDGIRCLIIDGVALSRSLKPIPNAHVQSLFGRHEYNGLDGELICGDPTAEDCYLATNSAVMSRGGTPDVQLHAFDRHDLDLPFDVRLARVHDFEGHRDIKPVRHLWAQSHGDLTRIEELALDEGFEGVMLRKPDGPYKQGRSTAKEGWLLKLKRFTDSEAVIVGFEELMHNGNEAKKDALGHTERSSHKENLVGMATLGALVVRDVNTQIEFNIGTGFTAATRAEIWANREALIGTMVKYKHFEVGAKDKPRFPVYLGPRDERDM